MEVWANIKQLNYVAIFCAFLSFCSFVLIIFSFFTPWVRNNDFLKEYEYCNFIIPPMVSASLFKSCTDKLPAEDVWGGSPFLTANIMTSASLILTLFVVVVSIVFDVSQLFQRRMCCITLGRWMRYLSLVSFSFNFIAVNLFIFIFFSSTKALDTAVKGALVEVSWGFWLSFISALVLLLGGFIDVSFSSPPKQKNAFL